MFMLNRLLSMFLHIHSPAMLHCYSFFCSSAFTSCLVCESTGLHLLLVLMEMCGVAPGGHNVDIFNILFQKLILEKKHISIYMKDNVFNISLEFLTL